MIINLKDGEKVVKIFRHSHAISLGYYFLIFIFIVAPFFFMFLLFSWGNWGVAFFSAGLTLGLYLLLRVIYFRYNNALVVSNERVVVVGRHGWWHKTLLELGHDNIVNVSYRIKGFFPTVFRYGRVTVQTARGGADLEFDRLAKPHAVSELINHTRGEFVHSKQQRLGGANSAMSVIEKLNFLTPEDLRVVKNVIDQKLRENSGKSGIA
ncbi:MAG: PH domain-containing protein [Patescibacteria group bacterium]